MVGTIYNTTHGACVDKVAWLLRQRMAAVASEMSEQPQEKELRIPIEEIIKELDCINGAVELLKAEGWRIQRYTILPKFLQIVFEL